MQQFDLTRLYPGYYKATPTPQVVVFPAIQHIGITGQGNPNEPAFAQRVQALYTGAFAIKQAAKQEGWNFIVPKMEGTWWTASGKREYEVPYEDWRWKLLLALPPAVQPALFEKAVNTAFDRKKLALLKNLQLETTPARTCVQLLHTGPYSEEKPNLEKLHAFMDANGLYWNGHHHEVYLSQPRRTAPEKLKTILRQPVQSRTTR